MRGESVQICKGDGTASCAPCATLPMPFAPRASCLVTFLVLEPTHREWGMGLSFARREAVLISRHALWLQWDNFAPYANYSGSGGWSFLDFIRMDEQMGCEAVAGEPPMASLCFAEQQAHFSLWVISGSPLILGFE